MNILNMLKSLLPGFQRSTVSEDIDQLRSEVKDNSIPEFQKAAAVIGSRPFKAAIVKAFNDNFQHELPDSRRSNFVAHLAKVFEGLLGHLEALDSLVESELPKDVAKDALTYRQASIIRLVEITRFAVTYANRSLIRFVAAEACAQLGKEADIDANLTPAELEWFKQNEQSFFKAIRLLAGTTESLKSGLESIPDVTIVPEKAGTVKATIGELAVDPLKLGLISAGWNPIYHLRLHIGEWQVKRYKAKLEEKKQLELRILELKEAYAGKQDPKLAQAITYSEGRLQKLSYEINEMAEELS